MTWPRGHTWSATGGSCMSSTSDAGADPAPSNRQSSCGQSGQATVAVRNTAKRFLISSPRQPVDALGIVPPRQVGPVPRLGARPDGAGAVPADGAGLVRALRLGRVRREAELPGGGLVPGGEVPGPPR